MSSDPVERANAADPVPTSVPLVAVTRQYEALENEIDAAIKRVCASGMFVLGPECRQLEASIAEYCQTPHAIGCASGSDALLLALMALGVGPGDEVILPSFTFFATGGAVARLGALPVFVDIEPDSFNMDPQRIASLVTPHTKAVIPVHLFGQCAEMDPICRVAQQHGLAVIEDAAQAIGAELNGRRAGSLSDMGCFSFYPTKNLAAFGDGGMLTTCNDDLAQQLRLLRVHGMEPRYHHHMVGINSRLDTIQAAVLNAKFPHQEAWTQARGENAARYTRLLSRLGLSEAISLPVELPARRHVWNQYVVRVHHARRDALREFLASHQIGTEIYYPVPLHQQACFKGGFRAGDLRETERAAAEVLALPIYPELTAAEQELVVARIGEFFGKRADTTSESPRPKFLEKHSSPGVRQAREN